MNLSALVYVGAGGALGAIARYLLTLWLASHSTSLPLGTLVSNLLGCFVMGGLLQWLAEPEWFGGTAIANEHYRLLFAVGFCGSFTTLSAMIYEMGTLLNASLAAQALAYVLASVVGGFLCFYAGIHVTRLLLSAG